MAWEEEEWSLEARLTMGAERRATCSLTLTGAGPHYVTLSCVQPQHQPQPQPRRDAASQTSATNLLQPPPPPPSITKGHLSRSPGRVRNRVSRGSKQGSGSGESKKNPRTVHIDVYCTASDSSGSSSEEESVASAQTVFETDKVRVVHTRANNDSVPHALQRQKRRVLSGGEESESSAYPSQRSSVVSLLSTLPSSSTVTSDNSVATSWKDTDLSLAQSDSFDYENSTDKLRIKEKEKAWAGKTWRSPESERKLRKKISERKDEDSETSDSSEDETEMAWSFGRYEELEKREIKREGTVRRVDVPKPPKLSKSGSLSDTEVGKTRPPRPMFEHLCIAEKFGALVGSLKRPGHHVGPSKNPDCSCDTCRYFFEHISFRNRTRSLGERPDS